MRDPATPSNKGGRPSKGPRRRIEFLVPVEQFPQVRAAARSAGLPMAEFVARLVTRELEARTKHAA